MCMFVFHPAAAPFFICAYDREHPNVFFVVVLVFSFCLPPCELREGGRKLFRLTNQNPKKQTSPLAPRLPGPAPGPDMFLAVRLVQLVSRLGAIAPVLSLHSFTPPLIDLDLLYICQCVPDWNPRDTTTNPEQARINIRINIAKSESYLRYSTFCARSQDDISHFAHAPHSHTRQQRQPCPPWPPPPSSPHAPCSRASA